jgi:hypothetical protein
MQTPLQLSFLSLPAPWECARMAVERFPFDAPETTSLKRFVSRLMFNVLARPDWNPSVYANVNHLHKDSLWKEFTRNAAEWKLLPGLGVFPDDPPRLMTADDFYAHQFDKPMRSMIDSMLAVSVRNNVDAQRIFEIIAGYGNTTVIFSLLDEAALRKQMSSPLRALIQDVCFQTSDPYIPMLNARNAAYVGCSSEVQAALAGVNVYFRECPEENGILLLSRVPLGKAFEAAGAHWNEHARSWYLLDSLPPEAR